MDSHASNVPVELNPYQSLCHVFLFHIATPLHPPIVSLRMDFMVVWGHFNSNMSTRIFGLFPDIKMHKLNLTNDTFLKVRSSINIGWLNAVTSLYC